MEGLMLTAVAACSLSVSTFCQPDQGEIVFGLELASDTSLSSCSDSFEQNGDFAFVGLFPRHVTGLVAIEVIKDGDPPRDAGGYVFSEPGNFYSGRWRLTDFPGTGHYVIEMKLGDDVLATGEFDLTE